MALLRYPIDWPAGTGSPGHLTTVSELGTSPNPFRRVSSIRMDLAQDGFVTLAVHDVHGRRIRTLAEGTRAAGRTELTWDGCDEGGRAVHTGVYFIRLATPAGARRIKATRVD